MRLYKAEIAKERDKQLGFLPILVYIYIYIYEVTNLFAAKQNHVLSCCMVPALFKFPVTVGSFYDFVFLIFALLKVRTRDRDCREFILRSQLKRILKALSILIHGWVHSSILKKCIVSGSFFIDLHEHASINSDFLKKKNRVLSSDTRTSVCFKSPGIPKKVYHM